MAWDSFYISYIGSTRPTGDDKVFYFKDIKKKSPIGQLYCFKLYLPYIYLI
jgi:hypothetical protein